MDREQPHPQDVRHEEAVDKMNSIVNNNSICLFTTMLEQLPLITRPMSVRKIDDEGSFWFLSSIDSHKNVEIAVDERVQMFFSNPSESEFLTVFGKATIVMDKQKIEELWHPFVETWFTGTDDPTLSAIKVKPQEADHWDVKLGKMVSMVKIVNKAITGIAMSEGESEKLVVS